MLTLGDIFTFQRMFNELRDQSDLFIFLLVDNRPSRKGVAEFFRQRFDWIDDLAVATGIFGFVFLETEDDKYRNPSLVVAEKFGIRPNQLPGIVVFSTYNARTESEEGVFLPLKAALFEERPDLIEDMVADFFSIIQDAKKDSDKSDLIDNLRKKIDRLIKIEKRRSLSEYISDKSIILAKFPFALLEIISIASAKEFGKRFGDELTKRLLKAAKNKDPTS